MPRTFTFPVALSYIPAGGGPDSERFVTLEVDGVVDTSTSDGGLDHLVGLSGGKWEETGNDAPLSAQELDQLNGIIRQDKKLWQELEDGWVEKYWEMDPKEARGAELQPRRREDGAPVEIVSGPHAGKTGTVVQYMPASPDSGQEHYLINIGEDKPAAVPEEFMRSEEKPMANEPKNDLEGLTTVGHLTAVDGNLIPTEYLTQKTAEEVPQDESKLLFDLPEEAVPSVSEAKDAAKPAEAEIRNSL